MVAQILGLSPDDITATLRLGRARELLELALTVGILIFGPNRISVTNSSDALESAADSGELTTALKKQPEFSGLVGVAVLKQGTTKAPPGGEGSAVSVYALTGCV